MESLMAKLKRAFNLRTTAQAASSPIVVTELPPTDFAATLKKYVYYEPALNVLTALARIQLPAPQEAREFLEGRDAIMIFANKYGLVLRILLKQDADNIASANNTPWVSKPIAVLDAGRAVVEICAGGKQETKKENIEALRKELENEGRNFWDHKFSNVARAPIRTPRFPDGVTIVIDRGAVSTLSNSIEPVKNGLSEAAKEAAAALDELYAPLKKAFEEGLKAGWKMEKFWSLCETYVQDGKLAAGWNEPQCEDAINEFCNWGNNKKTFLASQAAKHYEERLSKERASAQRVSSPAAAAPQ